MSRRDYLLMKLKQALQTDYDEEEAEESVLSKIDDPGSTSELIKDYLGDYIDKRKIEKVTQALESVQFWNSQTTGNPNYEKLKWMLATTLGDSYNHAEATTEILSRILSNELTEDVLKDYLLKYKVQQGAASAFLIDLTIAWPEPTLDPIDYANEIATLRNCEDDYQAIPIMNIGNTEKKQVSQESVERILQRSIIMALLVGIDSEFVKSVLPEFDRPFTVEDIKKETHLLKRAIIAESRMNTKINKNLDEIHNYQASKKTSILDYLLTIKKQLVSIDVSDLCRLIERAADAENRIQDKNILLFIGETGSGKTTTIKALLGYKMGRRTFKGIDWVTIVEKVQDPEVLDMHSNPSCKSVTRYPVAVKPRPQMKAGDIYLTDTPGWADTAGVEVQIANDFGVRKALRKCRASVPVVVISKESWGSRGKGIRNLAMTIASIFEDYESIKNSVAIVMNRFSEVEINQMEHMIDQVMEAMTPTEKSSRNCSSFISHLRQLAANHELLTFDPLKDNAQEFMKKLLKYSFQPPKKLFQGSTLGTKEIKQFCGETAKRVKYHLKVGNAEMVKYFTKSLERLNELLDEDFVSTELTHIRDDIEKTVREDFKKIIDEFGYKVRDLSLDKEAVERHFSEVKHIANDLGYQRIINNLDLAREAEMYYEEVTRDLANKFMKQGAPKSDELSQNSKALGVLKLLRQSKPLNENIERHFKEAKKWITEKISEETKAFDEALRKSEYETASHSYEAVRLCAKYRQAIEENVAAKVEPEIEVEQLKKLVATHIEKLVSDGRGYVKRFDSKGIAQIDERFNKIVGCYRFMSSVDSSTECTITQSIKEFNIELKRISNNELEGITKILNDARVRPITRTILEDFQNRFDRLKSLSQVESISLTVESQMEQIQSAIKTYIDSQSSVLKQATEMINKRPQDLKNNIGSIQTALKGIECLAQFGGDTLKGEARTIMDETVKDMETSLPRIFNGLSGRNTLNYSNSECVENFQKMCDAIDMEEVFSKLDKFEAEYKQLQNVNKRNKENMQSAVNSAMLCISTLRMNEVQPKKELDKSLYSNISLSAIESALKFVELVSNDSPFSELRENAINQLRTAGDLVSKFRDYCTRTINNFARMIIEADIDISAMKKQNQHENANIEHREQRERIGDRCREVWRWARRVCQQIKDIGEKYQTIKKIGYFDIKQLQEYFVSEVGRIEDSLTQEWVHTKNSSKKLDQINILVKKCETFKESDSDLIGSKAKDFINLRQEVRDQLTKIDSKAVSRVDTLLKNRNFGILKDHMDKLRGNHQEDSITYNEALQKIEDFSSTFLIEKRKELSRLKQNNLVLSDIVLVAEIQEEIVAFNQSCQGKDIEKLMKDFEGAINDLKPKIEEQIKENLQTDSVQDAQKLVHQLEAIEKNLIRKEGEPVGSMTKQYQDQISQKLESVENDIRQEKDSKLNNFFKKNPNQTAVKRIVDLRSIWDESLIKRIGDKTSDLEEDTLLEEAKAKDLKKEAEKMLQYIPEKVQETKRKELEKVYQDAISRIESHRNTIIRKTEEFNDIKKLEFDLIEKQVHFLKKTHNEEISYKLKRAIISAWEQRKKQFTGKSLRDCTEAFINKLNPFLVRAKPYDGIIGDSCNRLRKEFIELYNAEMSKKVTQVREQLAPKDKIDSEATKQIGESLVRDVEETFQCLNRLSTEEDSKQMLQALEKTYRSVATTVISEYEKASSGIKIEEMFEEKPDSQAFQKFETVMRVGKAVEAIQSQMNSEDVPKKISTDSLAGFKARLEELPKSEKIIKEFKVKMDSCVGFVSQFDIVNESYGEDELGLQGSLKQFQTSITNAKSYMQIYTHIGEKKVETETSETKLKNDMKDMRDESVRNVDKLDTEYEQKVLRKLNRNTLALTCYEKTFNTAPKYGQQVKQKIEEKIKSDSTRCEKLTEESKKQMVQADEAIKELKSEETREVERECDRITRDHEYQILDITETFQKQIDGKDQQSQKEKLRKEMEAEIFSKGVELKQKLKESKMSIQKSFKERREKVEENCKEKLSSLGKELSRLKHIETDLVVAKDECRKTIEKCIKKASQGGVVFTNKLAKGLEETGDAYAGVVLNENPKVFGNYNMKRYKELVENIGYESVADSIPDLTKTDRNNIKSKYKKFKEHLGNLTTDYSRDPTESFITQLKVQISKKAREASTDPRQSNGVELLAQIFAVWSIRKSTVSAEGGVEFLYEPHAAQVIAMFLILGICGDKNEQLGNRIAQVLTGEGKSIVLGGLSCYLALIGYDVYCMCYSRLLSRRDYEDFFELFQDLSIEDYVVYGTFGEVTQRLFNSDKRQLREDVRNILLHDRKCTDVLANNNEKARKKTLLVDEVDVFFARDFFGQYYTPSTDIKDKCIEDLATYVWQSRANINYNKLINSSQFQECLKEFPKLEKILKYNAADMISSVKNYKHNYVVHDGKIGYVLPEGISFKANYGWKTTFAYYYEAGRGTIKERPQDYAVVSVLCCEISYAELPRQFEYIMGVTGTLKILPKCQLNVLESWYKIQKFYSIPSVYGKSRREKLGTKVVKTDNHFTEICSSIKTQIDRNKPVIIFFPTIDMVNNFYQSREFENLKQNAMTLTEKNDHDATKSRIIRATNSRAITVLTKAFGRGIDFIVREKSAKQGGGLHVIQTFISEEQSEEIQIEGRSARQGSQGSYEMLISEDELKNVSLDFQDVDGKNPQKVGQMISKARNQQFDKMYSGQIDSAQKCKDSHKIAKQIIEYIREGKNEQMRQEINNLNKLEQPFVGDGKVVRTVIGLDATASMSNALDQVLRNLRDCLERTYLILKEKGISSGFQIQIVIYRNYNSDASKILEWSPFSNNANDLIAFLNPVRVDGGWANEAIENLYNHVLKFEVEVDQLIVIADAACNNAQETIAKRSSRGELYWKSHPRFAEVLNGDELVTQLAAKKIPVHSFYIGQKPANYFQDVSKRTNGACQQYDYSGTGDVLTAFIVEQVLNKIGGQKRGQQLVNAYRMRFAS